MKSLYLSVLLIIGINSIAQQNHTITANDFYFSPDTSFVNVGDTVRLYSNGYHSITEVDSTDWVNEVAASNGGFWVGFGSSGSQDWFVVNQAGKYYFNCDPHATMGMKGVLYVGSSLNLQDVAKHEFSVTIENESVIHLNYADIDNVKIYSMTGELIHSQIISNPGKTIINNLNLKQGIYLVSFAKGNKPAATRKVIIN